MSTEERGRIGQIAFRFFAFLAIVALGGVVLWLVSERHARTFAVERHGDELWVMRGQRLPVGYAPYRPADRVLADAYAPLPWLGDAAGELLAARFDERDVLDQALFRVLRVWIEARLEADDRAERTQAFGLLRRAELLGGLTAEQRDELNRMRLKTAFMEGRAQVEEAEAALRQGVARLRQAAQAGGGYAREAGELYDRIEGLSRELARALRSAPSATVTGPTAAPAPATVTPAPAPAEREPPAPAAVSAEADPGAK